MATNLKVMSTKELVGKGYGTFWNFKGRYRVVKGSRASKKSKTSALNHIIRLMQYPEANLLVVRKTYRTLQDSAFTELKWAIKRLGVERFWKIKESPLEMEYLPTGQKIYFRGLDDPLKVTSVTVDVGYLCWLWIEEAYEITSEEDFDVIDESIRGDVGDNLFKQVTLTFNPWNENHWMNNRFFKDLVGYDADGNPMYETRENPMSDDGRILAMTTNYMLNEWLDVEDEMVFEDMKVRNPRRYQVAGLGHWGVVEGLIYENWREESFNLDEVRSTPGIDSAFGLDFGYTNDPSSLFAGLIDKTNKRIYVFDEMYERGLSNEKIYQWIFENGYAKEKIVADSAEPKSIARLRTLGLNRIAGAKKGKDSVNAGIDFIQDYEIIIHPKCVNFLTEIGNYTWAKDKFDKPTNKPVDDFNHLMDAMRYALEEHMGGKTFSFD